MSIGTVLDQWREALAVAAAVAAPFLLVALAVGLVTSVLQAATQMQENVLAFVPKLVAIGLVLLLAGSFCLDRLGGFTRSAIESAATTRDGELR